MEEEISLREIVETILKGKWIIISITIAAVLIATIVSYVVLTPKYEAESNMVLNTSPEATSSDVPSVIDNYILTRLKLDYLDILMNSDEVLSSSVEEVSTDRKVRGVRDNLEVSAPNDGGELLNVKLQGLEPENNRELLSTIIDTTRTELSNRISEESEAKVEQLTTEIKNNQEELDRLVSEAETIAANSEDTFSVMLFQQLSSNNELLLNIDEQLLEEIRGLPVPEQVQLKQLAFDIQELVQTNSEKRTLQTKLEDLEPINVLEQRISVVPQPASDEPVAPNPLLNIAISLVIGLMLGIGIVFLREYWRNSAE